MVLNAANTPHVSVLTQSTDGRLQTEWDQRGLNVSQYQRRLNGYA